MTKLHSLALVILILIVSACQTPIAPDFKDVKDLKVSLSGFTSAKVTGEALFYNPNKATLNIRNLDMDVAVDGEMVTNIKKEFDIEAKGMSDFTVPIDLKLSLEDLQINSISSALNMLNGDEKVVHFKGKIGVKVYGINFKVPVDHKEKLKLKL
jgi:LEA14-like dessication related protein